MVMKMLQNPQDLRGMIPWFQTVRGCFISLVILSGFFLLTILQLSSRVDDCQGDEDCHSPQLRLLQLDARHEREIAVLQDRLLTLKRQLRTFRNLARQPSGHIANPEIVPIKEIRKRQANENAVRNLTRYFNRNIESSETLHGLSHPTEFHVETYERFDNKFIYIINPGEGKRVKEKYYGAKKIELQEAILNAIHHLNVGKQFMTSKYTPLDFVEGIYRTEVSKGTHYELYFSDKGSKKPNSYHKVSLFRPFGPPVLVDVTNVYPNDETIHIIMPLANRSQTFHDFLGNFVKVCVLGKLNTFLTVIYFGMEGRDFVLSRLHILKTNYNFTNYKFIQVNETFSRARALDIGVRSWSSTPDVLQFFCDVDVIFREEFLRRCRLTAEVGRRVYYPVVFSLYNPEVVYNLAGRKVPSHDDQVTISKLTGYWRDFGYGMACMYKSDYESIDGFNKTIAGWGEEDVDLYRKFVKNSSYITIRAVEPGLFHTYHVKDCDPKLSADQYNGCIRSKALNEASHAELGLLVFKDEVDVHKALQRNGQF